MEINIRKVSRDSHYENISENVKIKNKHTCSKAALLIAKKNLKQFELETDEAFIVRAQMERILEHL